MPATSQVQQEAAGAELRRRRSGAAPRMFESMSTEKLEHLASTPRKGLPYRATRSRVKRRYAIAALRARAR
jgi:hypothetical protein